MLYSQMSEQFDSHIDEVYWGTNINPDQVKKEIINFFSRFEINGNYVYIDKFRDIKETQLYTLNIDCNDLRQWHHSSEDEPLCNLNYHLIKFPNEMIAIFDESAAAYYREEIDPSDHSGDRIRITISNLDNYKRMRDLGPTEIDTLVSIKGIVVRVSEIIPDLKEALFRCLICGMKQSVALDKARIIEPVKCDNCKSNFSFSLVHNRCVFYDKQIIKLQETPDHMPVGETPFNVQACVYDDLVEEMKPGDKVEVSGIYKIQEVRINPNLRNLKTLYKTFLDVISIKKMATQNLNLNEHDDIKVSPEDKAKIEKLSKNKDIYNILTNSFAPSIWENDDIKKGLLLQLFGGVPKTFEQQGRSKFRGDINVLLIGDPSTAKSQFLQYVHKLAPRGIYTSGKGSSVVGLTAYVTRDVETRDIILESGALVLSDKGVCCIDEFDKMDDNTRTILHEAMEQQTISIAKAGIICQLNARTAILAAANPKQSKYNPKLSVVQNINIMPTLLSRFDLIYLILDKKDEVKDRRLANHILSLYASNYDGQAENDVYNTDSLTMIEPKLMSAYITQARKNRPNLNPKVIKMLAEEYVKMRQYGRTKATISATPRQLESLIRMAEASAKLRFSPDVSKEDVEEAIRLMKVATQQTATDPTTGIIDMDQIATGVTSSSRKKVNIIKDKIKTILRELGERAHQGLGYSKLLIELRNVMLKELKKDETVTEMEFNEALKGLEDEEVISCMGHNKNKTIKYN